MNEADNFALVPRPPGALEKAEPGAKRILSGMVADTLALARAGQPDKVVCTVLIGDDTDGVVPGWFEWLLPQMEGFERFNFRPINFKSASDLRTATQRQPFDLIVINFTRVRWDVPKNDVDAFDDVVRFLAHLKSKHNKPIIVFSTWGEDDVRLSAGCAQVGVNYFRMPLSPEGIKTAFLQALNSWLKTPLRSKEKIVESATHPRKTRPERAPRIVVVYDHEGVAHQIEWVIRHWFNNLEVLLFADSQEAWKELSVTSPDLLITEDPLAGMSGKEIVRRLADRKVTYPIVVHTGWGDIGERWVHEYANRGLNIKHVNAPWEYKEILNTVEAALKIQRSAFKKSAETTPQLRNERAPRIVVVDDAPQVRVLYKRTLRDWVKDATIMEFENGDEAWRELIREAPDFLISDLVHTGMDSLTMLRLLAEMKVKYPILIASGNLPSMEAEARKCTGPDLNVTLWTKPFSKEQLTTYLRTQLDWNNTDAHER